MISTLDPNTRQFLASLNQLSAQASKAQEQISSGRRINRPSDSPDEISGLLAARSQLASITQVQSNFNRIKGETDTAESTLSQATNLLDQVTSIGTEGSTDVLPADQKKILGDQVAGLEQQLVGLASTATGGRYLFSGDNDQQPPYTYSASGTPPYGTYQGSATTRKALDATGNQISIALTGQQIFEDPDPSKNVFGAVDSLRKALASGDTTSIQDAVSKVRTASAFLNNQLAFYGQVQNQVANTLDSASTKQLQLKTQISATEDADLASAILNLNQSQIHQQAALQAGAKVQSNPTLFDYLK